MGEDWQYEAVAGCGGTDKQTQERLHAALSDPKFHACSAGSKGVTINVRADAAEEARKILSALIDEPDIHFSIYTSEGEILQR